MTIFTINMLYCNIPLFIFVFQHLGERRGAYKALVGKTEGKGHVEDLRVDRGYH